MLERSFTFNWVYDLPLGTHDKAVGLLLNGWQFGGIYHQQSGLPFSILDGVAETFTSPATATSAVDRASFNPSFRGPIILGDPAKYFDPNAFAPAPNGVYGNTGSGLLTGPGLWRWTFR